MSKDEKKETMVLASSDEEAKVGPSDKEKEDALKTDAEKEADTGKKQIVFRSEDRSLRMVWTSSFTEKDSHGRVTYHPSEGVQFSDWQLVVEEIPKNKEILEKLAKHPSNGITFRMEPQETLADADMPTMIVRLEKMSEEELRDRLTRLGSSVTPDMTKEKMVLELVKVLTK